MEPPNGMRQIRTGERGLPQYCRGSGEFEPIGRLPAHEISPPFHIKCPLVAPQPVAAYILLPYPTVLSELHLSVTNQTRVSRSRSWYRDCAGRIEILAR